MTSLGFEKNSFWLVKKNVFWISEKMTKKGGFHFVYFSKSDDILFWIKNEKIEKMNVLFVFFKKYICESGKKNVFCLEKKS